LWQKWQKAISSRLHVGGCVVARIVRNDDWGYSWRWRVLRGRRERLVRDRSGLITALHLHYGNLRWKPLGLAAIFGAFVHSALCF